MSDSLWSALVPVLVGTLAGMLAGFAVLRWATRPRPPEDDDLDGGAHG